MVPAAAAAPNPPVMHIPVAVRTLLQGLALLATLPAFAADDCAKSRPEAVIADLYLRSGGLAQPAAQALLSAPLRTLLAQAEPADWSAWSGARATVGERLLVSDTLIEGRRASSRLSFSAAAGAASAPEKVFLQLQLVREADGCWRLDDIVRDESSLKALLQQSRLRPPESPASR
jgi:hypothetical protein